MAKTDWVETFAGFLDRWLEELDTRVKVQTRIMNMGADGRGCRCHRGHRVKHTLRAAKHSVRGVPR